MSSPFDEVGVSPMEPSSPDPQAIPATAPFDAPAELSPEPDLASTDAENAQWKDEVAARLSRYRARRKAPPPRYPSLKLPFGGIDNSKKAPHTEVPTYDSVSNQALAFEMKASEPEIIDAPEPAPPA